MFVEDFSVHDIAVCTPNDIEATGANLKDVELETILLLNQYYLLVKRKIVLLPNGLTSGKHMSINHPRGRAVDIAFADTEGPLNIYKAWKKAIQAGWTGIGIYWNGTAYSMHLDRRKDVAFWAGTKAHREKNWRYVSVFQDPKNLES